MRSNGNLIISSTFSTERPSAGDIFAVQRKNALVTGNHKRYHRFWNGIRYNCIITNEGQPQ